MIRLREGELRDLVRIQRRLLSPEDHEDVGAWLLTVSREFKDILGADIAGMFVPGSDGISGSWTDATLAEALLEYDEYFKHVDVAMNEWRLGLSDPSVFHEQDLFNRARLERDECFIDWRSRFKLFEPLLLTRPSPWKTPAVLVAFRDRDDRRNLLAQKRDLASLVVPAFDAAVERLMTGEGLDAGTDPEDANVEHGELVFDRQLRLLHASRAAVRIIASARSDVLEAARSMSEQAIRSEPVRPTMVVGSVRLGLLLRCDGDGGPVHAVIALERVRPPRLSVRAVHRHTRLTRRQSEVALLMARRQTYREIARALGIRPDTARGHCQAVLDRLGLHGREDVRDALWKAVPRS